VGGKGRPARMADNLTAISEPTVENKGATSSHNLMSLQELLKGYKKKKLHGLRPRADYTDRATAACRRSDCQLLRIEGATWSA
jgi:hypothetical protein